jgi:hypothetical protein
VCWGLPPSTDYRACVPGSTVSRCQVPTAAPGRPQPPTTRIASPTLAGAAAGVAPPSSLLLVAGDRAAAVVDRGWWDERARRSGAPPEPRPRRIHPSGAADDSRLVDGDWAVCVGAVTQNWACGVAVVSSGTVARSCALVLRSARLGVPLAGLVWIGPGVWVLWGGRVQDGLPGQNAFPG